MKLISKIFAFFLGLAFSLPAYSGDRASLNVIGFSPDGTAFAYEEYGIHDGSAVPY